MRDKFASYHPVINFTFFIVAIGCGMILLHPAFLAASVLLSMLYYLTAKGLAGLEVRGRDESVITGIVPDESGV